MSATFFRTTTPRGTDVLIQPLRHLRSCSVGFWVKRGSCHEAPSEEGLAHFIEHTVFKGTERYPNPQVLSEAMDALGGHVDAFTGKESACFYGKVLRERLPDLVTLLGELVTAPRFEAEELARERSVILEEIAQSEDQPDDWVSELFYLHFWPEGSLAHPILGRPEQVEMFGPETARTFFERTYRAPNLLVAAAGDVDPEAFLDLLTPILDRLPEGASAPPPRPNRPRAFVLNEPRRDLQQVNLVMGFPSGNHRDPDRVALHLLSHILGGGMSSRLFLELREKRALCYHVGSFLTPYTDTGALQITASCTADKAQEFVQRTLEECLHLAHQGVRPDELARAKLQARTSLVFGEESANSRMFSLAHQAIHMDRVRSLEERLAEVDAVDLDHLNAVAQRTLRPEGFAVSALGTRKGMEIRLPFEPPDGA